MKKCCLLEIFTLIFSLGCVHLTKRDLANKEDYVSPTMAAESGNIPLALRTFHDKEKNGFITTLEKGWLMLLSGQPDPAPLMKIADDIEARKTLYVSDETMSFFYKETEQGYFPAEHEVIIFHLVTAMSFAGINDRRNAEVEVRRASRYLEVGFDNKQRFDDPAIRLWLAALWTYCGKWEEARVDLRVAAKLSPGPGWLSSLAESPDPPARFILTLAGPGAEVEAAPETGFTSVKFSQHYLEADNVSSNIPTYNWYARHQQRNHLLKDIISKSKYSLDMAAASTASSAAYVSSRAFSTVVVVSSIALAATFVGGGIYVTYLLGATHCQEICAIPLMLGLLFGYGSLVVGFDLAEKTNNSADEGISELMKQSADASDYYRYVRFLPEKINYSEDLSGQTNEKNTLFLRLTSPQGESDILFFHHPYLPDDEYNEFSLKNYWYDRKNKTKWIFFAKEKPFGDAKELCQQLAEKRKESWKIPNWDEYDTARKNGILDPEINPKLSPILKETKEIWVENRLSSTQTSCHSLDLKEGSESLNTPCTSRMASACLQQLDINENNTIKDVAKTVKWFHPR